MKLTYDLIVCYQGGGIFGLPSDIVTDIVLANVEVDLDWLVDNCPDLPLPQSPVAQMEFLEELSKEFEWRLEQVVVADVLRQSDNGLCSEDSVNPVNVRRLKTPCYTYCNVVGFSHDESRPIIVRKVRYCGSR